VPHLVDTGVIQHKEKQQQQSPASSQAWKVCPTGRNLLPGRAFVFLHIFLLLFLLHFSQSSSSSSSAALQLKLLVCSRICCVCNPWSFIPGSRSHGSIRWTSSVPKANFALNFFENHESITAANLDLCPSNNRFYCLCEWLVCLCTHLIHPLPLLQLFSVCFCVLLSLCTFDPSSPLLHMFCLCTLVCFFCSLVCWCILIKPHHCCSCFLFVRVFCFSHTFDPSTHLCFTVSLAQKWRELQIKTSGMKSNFYIWIFW
jgi:hypothetical protein